MSQWQALQVNGVGRPEFHKNEREILVQRRVGIYKGKYKAQDYQDGRLYLTSQRICYVDSQQTRIRSMWLSLSQIEKVEYYGGFIRSSPKITLHLKKNSESERDTVDSTLDLALMATWVCPICYYSNEIAPNYLTHETELPVCKTCGIKVEKKVIVDALNDFAAANFALSETRDPQDAHTEGFRCSRCTFLNHPSLSLCEMCGARLLSARLPPALASPSSSSQALMHTPAFNERDDRKKRKKEEDDSNIVKLSFRDGGDKLFHELLKQAISDNVSNKNEPVNQKTAPKSSLQRNDENIARGIGLLGLEQVGEQTRRRNEQVLGDALEDLQSLMARAKDVVTLAESYAKRLETADLKTGTADAGAQARQALWQSSQALGLNLSIVTKEMVQNNQSFHEELSRQIAEFLVRSGVLEKEGGTVTVFDAFAFYNRARGISLVSPKDFYSACHMFEKLKLPARLKKFRNSGVLVVQEAHRTPAATIRQILNWYAQLAEWQKAIGVSTYEVSEKFHWSPMVAMEELEMAEQMGAMCRDETMSGVRFFDNKFVPYNEIR